MKSAVAELPPTLLNDDIVPLASVLCTEELKKRPARVPDYAAENRALAALVKALADSPRTILQTLAEKILEVFNAGSAGVSLLTKEDGGKRFHWPAIAGMWKPHIGGGTPRDFGPCGDVLDFNTPLLFRHFEQRYTYFLPVTPPVEECLLVPFYVEGKAVGTIWAIAHDKNRKFDSEDLRMLESVGRFASAAYQAVQFLHAFQQQDESLRQNRAELSQRIADLQMANAEARESRRAALNLMEDAVQSRQAIEKLNAELRQSEERYRTLFDLGPVAVYSIDPSGLIQLFNRRAAELWGREPALGDTEARFCGSFKLFRPDGTFMPHEECPMAEVVAGTIPAAHDAEVIIERPDCSRVTVIVNIRPLKNERGEITGAINCFYDITERKQAEMALREAGERFRFMAESMPQKVFSATPDGRCDYFNQQWIQYTGAVPEQVAGWAWTEFLHPDEKEETIRRWKHSIETGEPFESQNRYRRRDREYRWHLSRAHPMRDAKGKVLMWIGSNTDIDDQKRAEAKLEKIVQERTAKLQETISELEHFSYTITHDMRAPLRAMQGFGGMALSACEAHLTPEVADYLQRITGAACRMDALIRDSLQYAKVIREKIPLAPVEPSPVLRGILESYPSLQSPRVEIQIVEPLPPVIANEAGLAQCFSNLLINAVKFVKPDKVPQVRVSAQARGHHVRFWFEDNGIGIPSKYHERIFSMFQQLDKSYEGTGIGLALVRKTAQRMEGKVGVESEPGKGSRFWLEFKKANPPIR